MAFDDVVAYQYRADEYCPACIVAEVAKVTFVGGFTLSDADPEDALGKIAATLGIDRMDEYSYDSDEFPKICFAHQMEDFDDGEGNFYPRICTKCHAELS